MKNNVWQFRFEEKTLRAMIAIYCSRVHCQVQTNPLKNSKSLPREGTRPTANAEIVGPVPSPGVFFNSPPALCPECAALERYALQRLEHCVFGPQKPACADCVVHCYKPVMREKVRAAMRFAGPLMIKYHPVLALAHLIRRLRRPERKPRRASR